MKRLLALFIACGSAAGRALRSSALLSVAGYTLLVSSGASATAAEHAKQAEPLQISHGETIALTDFLVPGKTVVFDFTSKFCPPCQAYNEPLKLLHARRADIVVVKVDINRPDVRGIDWQSPVALQYDLHAIPHFKVYSPEGKLLAEDKMIFAADGSVDRTLSTKAASQLVNQWINALGN